MIGGTVVLLTPLVLLGSPQSRTVALVGRAGSDTGDVIRVVAEAGGSVLTVGGRPDVVIARSERPGFVSRLYAAGARLVVDGGLAGGCGRETRDSHPVFGRLER